MALHREIWKDNAQPGHSQILELDERFRVNRCPELETELSMYN